MTSSTTQANAEKVIALANQCGIDTDEDGDIWGSTNGALLKFARAIEAEVASRCRAQGGNTKPSCATCNDHGAVGHAPDDYFPCPDCTAPRILRAQGGVTSNEAADERSAIPLTLATRNGEPQAAYPRRKQAEVYASGHSSSEGVALIDGLFFAAPSAAQEGKQASAPGQGESK